MRCTVQELLERVSEDELQELFDLWEIAPFGPWADDFRWGHLVATIANANRNPKTRKKPFLADDFMLSTFVAKSKKKQKAGNMDEGLHAAFMRLARLHEAKAALAARMKAIAPHMSDERIAEVTERVRTDGR